MAKRRTSEEVFVDNLKSKLNGYRKKRENLEKQLQALSEKFEVQITAISSEEEKIVTALRGLEGVLDTKLVSDGVAPNIVKHPVAARMVDINTLSLKDAVLHIYNNGPPLSRAQAYDVLRQKGYRNHRPVLSKGAVGLAVDKLYAEEKLRRIARGLYESVTRKIPV